MCLKNSRVFNFSNKLRLNIGGGIIVVKTLISNENAIPFFFFYWLF